MDGYLRTRLCVQSCVGFGVSGSGMDPKAKGSKRISGLLVVQYSTNGRWDILSKVGWVWVTTTLYILSC